MGKFVSCFELIRVFEALYSITWGRADYMQGTRLSFRSKEDAIHFAEKQGAFAPVGSLFQ